MESPIVARSSNSDFEIFLNPEAAHPSIDFSVPSSLDLDKRASILPHRKMNESRWQERRFKPFGGLVYLPAGFDAKSGRKLPCILFLHGRGESGDKPRDLLKVGLPEVLDRSAFPFTAFPFIVLAPQCPWDTDWASEVQALAAYLQEAARALPIDPARVYLTGMSMGGFGAIALAHALPTRFAAVVPVCSGVGERQAAAVAAALREVPVWVVHGAADDVIPVELSRNLIRALEAAGARFLRTTIYPEADHDSWTSTYEDPQLYRWMLEHAGSEVSGEAPSQATPTPPPKRPKSPKAKGGKAAGGTG